MPRSCIALARSSSRRRSPLLPIILSFNAQALGADYCGFYRAPFGQSSYPQLPHAEKLQIRSAKELYWQWPWLCCTRWLSGEKGCRTSIHSGSWDNIGSRLCDFRFVGVSFSCDFASRCGCLFHAFMNDQDFTCQIAGPFDSGLNRLEVFNQLSTSPRYQNEFVIIGTQDNGEFLHAGANHHLSSWALPAT